MGSALTRILNRILSGYCIIGINPITIKAITQEKSQHEAQSNQIEVIQSIEATMETTSSINATVNYQWNQVKVAGVRKGRKGRRGRQSIHQSKRSQMFAKNRKDFATKCTDLAKERKDYLYAIIAKETRNSQRKKKDSSQRKKHGVFGTILEYDKNTKNGLRNDMKGNRKEKKELFAKERK